VTKFCRELLPDLRHLVRYRRVGGRVTRVDRVERGYQDRGGGQAAEPLAVGRHDIPRRPLCAGLAQHGLEGPLVVLPVAPVPDVAGGELPVLLRLVDALEEPLGLLPFGQVQHDLDDTDPVVDQVALPVVDLPVAAGPDPVIARDGRHPLRGQQFLMDPDHEHLLVVGPVEDADPAPPGQGALVPPQEVVVQLLGRGLLEGPDLHRLRVDPAHHVLDRAVLARGVDSLQHQEHAERVLGGEPVLVIGQQLHAIGEQRGGLRAGHAPCVARVVVAAQPDLAPGRHLERRDEVGHEAKALVHPLTMADCGPAALPAGPAGPVSVPTRAGWPLGHGSGEADHGQVIGHEIAGPVQRGDEHGVRPDPGREVSVP